MPRASAFAGAGYLPAIDSGDGFAFALGMRAFTGGRTHRGFLELSASQVAVEVTRTVRAISGPLVSIAFEEEDDPLYGPGLQAGYQYLAGSGFTLAVSLGVGYAPGMSDELEESPFTLLGGLGLGYTWR